MNAMNDENNLSWGKVAGKDTLKQINLPKSMIEPFIKNTITDNVLIVFTPRQNLLKIDVFPIESKEIIKIQLILTQFSGNTVKQIGQIIRDMNIPKNLFTSGVCIKSNLCVYEAYIEKDKLKVPLETLKDHFNTVENVVDVFIDQIHNEQS